MTDVSTKQNGAGVFDQQRPEEPREIPFYERLIADVKDKVSPLATAVIYPVTWPALQGALASAEANILVPVLIGPRVALETLARNNNADLSAYRIEDIPDEKRAVQRAVEMATTGEVQALMKGHLHTSELLKGVLDKSSGLRTWHRMSHVFAIDVPHDRYPKPLFLSDAAINITPTLEDKRHIVQNAIDLFRACHQRTPKVAILSATEKINSAIVSTMEAAALCKMADRGDIVGGILEGPLAFDNAISKEAAELKGIQSDVPGDVDILIVPDLVSGNMLYKQMKFLSGYDAAGIVMGAKVPVILTSRAGGEKARMASAALALRYVNGKQGSDEE